MSSLHPTRPASYAAAAGGLMVTIAFVMYPEAAFSASWDGLKLWFEVVLPALLPFFAMAEILMGLGVIHAVGVFMEPLMRPVFRIPGVGGFAVAMGLASGYPLGAKISGRIRREGLCTREEGERLLSFANTADPLFMVGAVAVGMFAAPEVGVPIAVAHYAAAILVGFLMRMHAGGRMGDRPPVTKSGPIVARALSELVEARRRDGRPFGELFGDAIKESMNSMLFIGGCIMMFSVFIRVLMLTGVMGIFETPIQGVFHLVGISYELVPAIIHGAMEITIGAQAAATAHAELLQRCIIAGAVIGWSGFSVHAQAAAMVYGTDIRMTPYLLARLTHGILAALFTWMLFGPLGGAGAALQTAASYVTRGIAPVPIFAYWATVLGLGGAALIGMIALSLIVYSTHRIKIIFFKVRP